MQRVARVTLDHTQIEVYNKDVDAWRGGGRSSLSLFSTDQILVARWLADRQGCYLHSAGAIVDGQGLLFVGHSGAGKTTAVRLLQDQAEILCDDRNIVRRSGDHFDVYGTWSQYKLPVVSAASAPLAAILFLHQSYGESPDPPAGSGGDRAAHAALHHQAFCHRRLVGQNTGHDRDVGPGRAVLRDAVRYERRGGPVAARVVWRCAAACIFFAREVMNA